MGEITETLGASITVIMRKALGEMGDPISPGQAVKEIRRAQLVAACSRYGPVPEGMNDKQLNRYAARLGLGL